MEVNEINGSEYKLTEDTADYHSFYGTIVCTVEKRDDLQ